MPFYIKNRNCDTTCYIYTITLQYLKNFYFCKKEIMDQNFALESFINLETFRKNGNGIKTPVWFLLFEQKIYVRTLADSGKVKRVRANSKVNFAPCTSNGTLTGSWAEGSASLLLDEIMGEKINRLLTKKYGVMKKVIDLFSNIQKKTYAIIEIKI